MMVGGHDTEFGFEWGGAKVSRITSNDRKGWIVLSVESKKGDVQIYVTRTGKMRLYDDIDEIVGRGLRKQRKVEREMKGGEG